MFFLHLNKVALRSFTKPDSSNNENTDETVANKFIVLGTVVTLTADSSSINTLVCQSYESLSQEDEKDNYEHTIRVGHEHTHGHFLEKKNNWYTHWKLF